MSNAGLGSRPGAAALFVVALLVGSACASAGGGGGGGDPDVITREQVLAMPEGNAYTIIQRYRASWLRRRSGGLTTGEPDFARVFLDELEYGDLDSLRRISATRIASIEYMSPLDATTRYGTGYAGGLIRVNSLGR